MRMIIKGVSDFMKVKKLMTALMLSAVMLMPGFAPAVKADDTAEAQKLDTVYTLALNAIAEEDYESAKEYLSICFVYCTPESNPDVYADLLLKRACIDLIDGKDELALLSVEAALKVQPDMADAYLVLTQVYAGQGDVDKAIENLETYIDLTEDTELYETVAQLHEAKGDYESAVAAYDKYVAGAGAEVEEAGFQSGLYRMESGKYESAIEAFTPYKESELYGAGALYNIGICQMSLGDYAAARESLTACEEKGGGFDGLYYNRGICALMAEEWESAAADFEKSIESEPYKTDAAYNLGICQMQAEAYEEAISSFTGLIDNAGEEGVNDSVYYYRAICLTAVGKLEEALADYTTCIEHEYELAQSYYQRSQVYASLGDAEKQTADLEASLKYAG